MRRRPDQYKDRFKNFTFSPPSWSAETLVSADNIRKLISSFNLEGRKIKRMKIIGLSYNLTRDRLEDIAYDHYEELDEGKRQEASDYYNIDPSFEYARFSQFDEPFLVEFEDGESFEIDTPMVPEFRMSMNCIPFGIKEGVNTQNASAQGLFFPCVGKTIESVNIETFYADDEPIFDEPENGSVQKERVSKIGLKLEGGLELCFEGWFDFCTAYLLEDNKQSMISFGELKEYLYNWEDIHEDNLIKNEATCRDFYYGEEGQKRIGYPYIALYTECKDNGLFISPFDFKLFDWSIASYTNRFYDENADYEFTFKEWNEILSIAKTIVSFTEYKELYEYIRDLKIRNIRGICHSVDDVDKVCKRFWDDINRYKNQLENMEKWSSRLLTESDKMIVLGF